MFEIYEVSKNEVRSYPITFNSKSAAIDALNRSNVHAVGPSAIVNLTNHAVFFVQFAHLGSRKRAWLIANQDVNVFTLDKIPIVIGYHINQGLIIPDWVPDELPVVLLLVGGKFVALRYDAFGVVSDVYGPFGSFDDAKRGVSFLTRDLVDHGGNFLDRFDRKIVSIVECKLLDSV